MKLLYVAVTLMFALLVTTAYLALQARDESVKANAKMDLLTQQQRAAAAQNEAKNAAMVELPSAAPVAAAPAPVPTSPSRPAGSTPVASPPVIAESVPVAVETPASAIAPMPAPAPAPSRPSLEMPLTPMQVRVKAAPSMGKVKEFVPEQGFVVVSAGTKQGLTNGLKLDLRRGAAVVGRITITTADEGESVADVDPKATPPGVMIQAGDEIIGVMLPQ